MKTWHRNLLDDLISRFEPDEDVLGLLLFGSCSKPLSHYDDWSDIDILVVVSNGKIENFFPTVDWITFFGSLYTYTQSSDEFKFVTRVCFENFNRIDFVITTEEKLANVTRWPGVPFFSGTKTLLSRSHVVEEIASQGPFPPILPLRTDDEFLELVRNFRFKSMQAVYKVVRNDLLVALQLTQDLIRELFEKLAGEWSRSYREHRQPLLNWIEEARAELAKQRATYPGKIRNKGSGGQRAVVVRQLAFQHFIMHVACLLRGCQRGHFEDRVQAKVL